jgi:hypothetical protein
LYLERQKLKHAKEKTNLGKIRTLLKKEIFKKESLVSPER